MARLSINEMTTFRWSFEEDVCHYRTLRVEGIGVWRQKLADFGEEKGAELLAGSGLQVSNLLWAGGFTGSDGRTYQESLKDAREAVRLAATLKAGCLVVHSGGRNSHTLNHARRLFLGALRELLPLAEELGVTLAVEPMHAACAAEWTFLTGLTDALNLLDALDSPHVKLAFDTYHLGHDPRIVDFIPRIAERIAIVHLGDSKHLPCPEQNRHPLGEGVLPLREMVAALVDAGYDGFFDVELMGEEIEASDYLELLERSKRVFEQLLGAPAAQRSLHA